MADSVRILIAGAGGHGQVVADILLAGPQQGGRRQPIGFLDDDPRLTGAARLGLSVLGTIADAHQVLHDAMLIGVGDNDIRRRIYLRLAEAGERFEVAVHPSATLGRDTELGAATVVCANVTVNPGARIGANVILNTGCIVEHHCTVAAHAHIAPGACMGGEVSVGEGTLVGIGSVILPGVRIGRGCIVGGGSVVTADIADNRVVAGVPARIIRKTPAPQIGTGN